MVATLKTTNIQEPSSASTNIQLDSSGNVYLTPVSGNVGIGTTSPSAKLHVYGSAPQILAQDSSTGIAQLITKNGTANSTWGVDTGSGGITGSANAAYWYNAANTPSIFFTNAAERMRIDSSGNLLVGKTSSSNTNIGVEARPLGAVFSTCSDSTSGTTTYHVYSTGAGAYRFYVGLQGQIYCTNTTITALSDQRFKENVTDLDVGLNAIMALKPRKFDWKEGKGKDIKGDRGFIAQEFEQVFPDLIEHWKDPAPEGEEPYKAVRPDLIPVLVKALQELKATVDAQAAEITALKAKVGA
jgi:hypothetical protein